MNLLHFLRSIYECAGRVGIIVGLPVYRIMEHQALVYNFLITAENKIRLFVLRFLKHSVS